MEISIGKSWRQHAFVPSAPTSIYKLGENYILFPSPDDIWRKYILIYIVLLCMQKEIIGQIVILRKSKTFAIGWVRGFSFQLPETTRKKIYQSHETLGSYSNSARPDSCMKGWRVHGILRHTLQVPLVVFLSAAKLVRFLLVLLVISNHHIHNE